VYTQFAKHEIMFHVSTLMPNDEDRAGGESVARKRHIGNDVVVLVYQDCTSEAPFDVRSVRSKMNHVYVIVRALDDQRYSVAVARRTSVPQFGPPLPAHTACANTSSSSAAIDGGGGGGGGGDDDDNGAVADAGASSGVDEWRVGDATVVSVAGECGSAPLVWGDALRRLLLTKLINAERASFSSSTLAPPLQRTREILMKDFIAGKD
jgi:hypothetical protein